MGGFLNDMYRHSSTSDALMLPSVYVKKLYVRLFFKINTILSAVGYSTLPYSDISGIIIDGLDGILDVPEATPRSEILL